MADIPYVCLYASYLDSLSPFTDEECGRLVRAMLNYAATGEVPQFESNERFIWPSLQAQIDRDIDTYQTKCARNKANGAKGGRPPKNQAVISETERFLEKPKKPKEKEKESIEADKPPTRHRFIPPTVDEVKVYCAENGYAVDPARFVDYYTSNGWRVGKTPMKDWKAAVRTWNRKEQPNNGKKEAASGRIGNGPAIGKEF